MKDRGMCYRKTSVFHPMYHIQYVIFHDLTGQPRILHTNIYTTSNSCSRRLCNHYCKFSMVDSL